MFLLLPIPLYSFCIASNNQVDSLDLMSSQLLGFSGTKMLIEYFCFFEIKAEPILVFFPPQTLMSARMASFSVIAVLTASTCLGGTTVSAEMATMTMECFPPVENRAKVSIEDLEFKNSS